MTQVGPEDAGGARLIRGEPQQPLNESQISGLQSKDNFPRQRGTSHRDVRIPTPPTTGKSYMGAPTAELPTQTDKSAVGTGDSRALTLARDGTPSLKHSKVDKTR